MPEPQSYAYSLSQIEDGWSWNIYDVDGEVVARGADACRDAAQRAIDALLKTVGLGGASIAA